MKKSKPVMSLFFKDIEEMICELCKSAYNYPAYWQPSPYHVLSNIIFATGFRISRVDLLDRRIRIILETG